jgi:hypothetical protein
MTEYYIKTEKDKWIKSAVFENQPRILYSLTKTLKCNHALQSYYRNKTFSLKSLPDWYCFIAAIF